MANKKHILTDSLFTAVTLIVVFLVNLFLVRQFDTKTMTPMIFVLCVSGFLADPGLWLRHCFQPDQRAGGELGLYLPILGL